MSSVRGRLPGAGRPTALEVGDRLINQTGFQERAGQRGLAINEQRPYPAATSDSSRSLASCAVSVGRANTSGPCPPGVPSSSRPSWRKTASWTSRRLCTSPATSRTGVKVADPNPPIFPPASTAYPSVTKGRLPSSAASHGASTKRLSSSRTPTSTSTPAFRNAAAPPSPREVGSMTEMMTRAIPASMRAWRQGGVRPRWLHGSSVTIALPPLARSLAAASAWVSACGSPLRSW